MPLILSRCVWVKRDFLLVLNVNMMDYTFHLRGEILQGLVEPKEV